MNIGERTNSLLQGTVNLATAYHAKDPVLATRGATDMTRAIAGERAAQPMDKFVRATETASHYVNALRGFGPSPLAAA